MTSTTLHQSGLINSMAAGGTSYGSVLSGFSGTPSVSTESLVATPQRTAGVYSNLAINVLTNDRGTSTYRFRSGGANGNQAISIASSTTGWLIDTNGVDSVPGAGELVNYQIVIGAGGTTFTRVASSIRFTPIAPQNTIMKYFTVGGGGTQGASITSYSALGGFAGSTTTTEANMQFKVKLSGTFQNMFITIGTNSRSDATVFRFRKAGADGNGACSIAASTTGVVEDTTHTDSVSSGDLVNYSVATGAGTGTITFGQIGIELVTTDGTFHEMAAGNSGGIAQASNLTQYYPITGSLTAVNATESNVQSRAGIPFVAKNLEVYVVSNTYTSATLIVGPPSGVISIAASTTGYVESTNDPVSFEPTTTASMDYTVLTPNDAGHSITFNCLGFMGTIQPEWVADCQRNQYHQIIGR